MPSAPSQSSSAQGGTTFPSAVSRLPTPKARKRTDSQATPFVFPSSQQRAPSAQAGLTGIPRASRSNEANLDGVANEQPETSLLPKQPPSQGGVASRTTILNHTHIPNASLKIDQDVVTSLDPGFFQSASGSRQSVRRADGKRAESESASMHSSLRGSSVQNRIDQSRARDDLDQSYRSARVPPSPRGSTFASLRKLIRMPSSKSKSNSISSLPVRASPVKSQKDLFGENYDFVPGEFGQLQTPSKPSTAFHIRNKSKDASSRTPKNGSVFSSFRARDPVVKSRKSTSDADDESFGNDGPMGTPSPSARAAGLPSSSSAPPYSFAFSKVGGAVPQLPPMISFPPAALKTAPPASYVQLGQTIDIQPTVSEEGRLSGTATPDGPLERRDWTFQQALMLSTPNLNDGEQAPSPRIDEGMGVALGSGSTDFGNTLAMSGLTASEGRQLSEPGGAEAARSGRSPFNLTTSSTSSLSSKPHLGIPRIWQAQEPTEAPLLSEDRDHPSSDSLNPSRFDTATTTGSSSFRTADSTLEASPLLRPSSSLRPSPRPAIRGLEPISARKFDFGPKRPDEGLLSDLSPADLDEQKDGDQGSGQDAHAESGLGTGTSAANGLSPIPSVNHSDFNGLTPAMNTERFSGHLDEDETENLLASPRQTSEHRRRNTFGGADRLSERGSWLKGIPASPRGLVQSPSESQIVSREISVSEIESHLAAVEAALADNSIEGSFDPASMMRGISESMFGQDGGHNEGDMSMPGAWDDSMITQTGRITLPPASQDAIADAVRRVRRAISFSQGRDQEDQTDGDPSYSREQEDTVEELKSNTDHPGDTTAQSEVTPIKAARRRLDSMRDIEESYGRMLALVQSSAVGASPSPMHSQGIFSASPLRRDRATSGNSASNLFQASPLSKGSAPLTAQDKRERTKSTPNPQNRGLGQKLMGSQRGVVAKKRYSASGAETAASSSLSGLMGLAMDEGSLKLRGRKSASSMGSRRAASESPVRRAQEIEEDLDIDKTFDSSYSLVSDHGLGQTDEGTEQGSCPAEHADEENAWSRSQAGEGEKGIVHRPSSGAGGTSPSATAKTLGTPRSQRNASGQPDQEEWDNPRHPRMGGVSDSSRQTRNEDLRDAPEHSSETGHGQGSVPTSAVPAPRSPAFESRMTSTGEAVRRSIEEQRRRNRAHLSLLSATGSSSLRHVDLRSPTPTHSAAGTRSRAEGSIRDWTSSHSAFRPTSRSSAFHSSSARYSRASEQDGRLRSDSAGGAGGSSATDHDTYTNPHARSPTSQLSVPALLRRHDLERESLLDSLERARAEVAALQQRHDEITSDLHAEVTRVLELERELERKHERELELLARNKDLENEVNELRRERAGMLIDLQRTASVSSDVAQASVTTTTNTATTSGSISGANSMSSWGVAPSDSPNRSLTTMPMDFPSVLRPLTESNSSYQKQQRSLHAPQPPPLTNAVQASAARRTGHRPTASESGFISPSVESHNGSGSVTMTAGSIAARESPWQRTRPLSLTDGPAGLIKPSKLVDIKEKPSVMVDDGDLDQDEQQQADGVPSKNGRSSPTLKTYPSLLGLNLKADEMNWNLVDEQPPEEAARDSLDELRSMDMEDFSGDSSFGGYGAVAGPLGNSAILRSSSGKRNSSLVSSRSQGPTNGLGASTNSNLSSVASSIPVSSTATTLKASSASPRSPGYVSNKRVGGGSSSIGLGMPSSPSLSRFPPSGIPSPSRRNVSSSSNRSIPSRFYSGSTSGSTGASSGSANVSTVGVGSGGAAKQNASQSQVRALESQPSLASTTTNTNNSSRNFSNATTNSGYTHGSSFTARSDSPLGDFVTHWRGGGDDHFAPPPPTFSSLSSSTRSYSAHPAKPGTTKASTNTAAGIRSSSTFGSISRLGGGEAAGDQARNPSSSSTTTSSVGEGLASSSSTQAKGSLALRVSKGGYYDPRRPPHYDPTSLPPSHQAMLQDGDSSLSF
ncbi:hypothetical protein IE53DRAFT_386077 [Violaceomyces palustris]|uniref:Uncharacterized protein n=1 Tax=Violaceomyces palustris TaxID=1673888 RepID=A0ACD0P0M0_9BASI|nr:hypothetical protein IE53DRAFT_386077 [Violaceomyces palustris]